MARPGTPLHQPESSERDSLPHNRSAAAREIRTAWPQDALELAQDLQRKLAIGDRDWHLLKGQRSRRGAEQLAAALVHLLAEDQPAQVAATPARERAIELVDHGLSWLRAELSDPGCPSHGR